MWLLCAMGSLQLTMLALGTEQFVLPKQKTKKLSKNELKESVGQEIRDAFMVTTNVVKCAGMCHVTMSTVQEVLYKKDGSMGTMPQNIIPLQKTLGNVHIELAQLQQKFSQLIERLVDDQKPFKHASRDGLNAALNVVQEVQQGLKGHEDQLVSLNKRLAKMATEQENVTALISFNKAAAGTVEDIKSYVTRINSCAGLRVT